MQKSHWLTAESLNQSEITSIYLSEKQFQQGKKL